MTGILHVLFGMKGRITRAQFWGGTLFSWFIIVLIVAASELLKSDDVLGAEGSVALIGVAALWIAFIWMSICVRAKRYHDRNKSGWFQLISLIPVIGFPWMMIELGFFEGTPGGNEYGPSPKGTPNVSEVFV